MKMTVVITRDDGWYVAHCLDLDVVSQGRTIEEAQANIKEAVELYRESFPETANRSSGEVLLYQVEVA